MVRGHYKGRTGKVTSVYRKKWVIHIERISREKGNGQVVPIGLDASKVEVVKLHMDKSRKQILARKSRSADDKNKVRDLSAAGHR